MNKVITIILLLVGLCCASMIIGPEATVTLGDEFAYLPEEVNVVTVDMTTTATYTAVNVTEDGMLSGIRIRFFVTADGLPNIDLVVTTDGSAVTIPFFNGSLLAEFGMAGYATNPSGASSVRGDTYSLPIQARYGTSLRVDAIVNTASTTVGSFDLSVLRSTKLGTSSQTIFGGGFLPQPMSVAEGIELNPSTNTNTSILSVTESGILHGIGFRVECPASCGGSAGATVAVGTFTITIDGTARIHTLYQAATGLWVQGITGMARGFPPPSPTGDGDEEGDVVYLPWQLRYLTSLDFEVDINMGGAGTATMRAFALRSVEL